MEEIDKEFMIHEPISVCNIKPKRNIIIIIIIIM